MIQYKLLRKPAKELTVFIGKLQLRFSTAQTAAWWGYKQLFSFGKGHR